LLGVEDWGVAEGVLGWIWMGVLGEIWVSG
jgi:hypothetical protein